MSITWKDVWKSKEFEGYILGHMKASQIIKANLEFEGNGGTGSCDTCSFGGCTRYCVDMKGTYKGIKFVIDAKFYTSGKYITEEDIVKLERDKRLYGAEVGFILTFGAKISVEMEAYAEEGNIFIIHVRNGAGNPTRWISKFDSNFK